MDVCARACAWTRRARFVFCLALVAMLPATFGWAEDGADGIAEPFAAAGTPTARTAEIAGPPASLLRSRATVLAEASQKRARAWRGDAAIVTAGQLADLASTEIALSRPGTREANTLLGNRAVRIPLKLGVAVGTSLGCYRLRRDGHHGTARALSIVSFAVGAVAAVHNLRVAR